MKTIIPYITFLIIAATCGTFFLEWNGKSESYFNQDGSGQYYNYAPCVRVDPASSREYLYYCKNKNESEVVDYIYVASKGLTGGATNWTSQQIALSPSSSGWDSYHICDPCVVDGAFEYNGETYAYAMFYLGTDSITAKANRIGVAFAKDPEGPFVKYSGNPIVPFSDYNHWGVGQQAAIKTNTGGEFILFYSRGDSLGTRILKRSCNFADMGNATIGPASAVLTEGLTSGDGSNVIFHNADFAYSQTTGKFVVIRPQHPFDTEIPDWVSSKMEIAWIDESALQSGSGSWKHLGLIDSNDTGKPRNHNACIATLFNGHLVDSNKVACVITSSDLGGDWIWGYRMYQINGDISPR